MNTSFDVKSSSTNRKHYHYHQLQYEDPRENLKGLTHQRLLDILCVCVCVGGGGSRHDTVVAHWTAGQQVK